MKNYSITSVAAIVVFLCSFTTMIAGTVAYYKRSYTMCIYSDKAESVDKKGYWWEYVEYHGHASLMLAYSLNERKTITTYAAWKGNGIKKKYCADWPGKR